MAPTKIRISGRHPEVSGPDFCLKGAKIVINTFICHLAPDHEIAQLKRTDLLGISLYEEEFLRKNRKQILSRYSKENGQEFSAPFLISYRSRNCFIEDRATNYELVDVHWAYKGKYNTCHFIYVNLLTFIFIKFSMTIIMCMHCK